MVYAAIWNLLGINHFPFFFFPQSSTCPGPMSLKEVAQSVFIWTIRQRGVRLDKDEEGERQIWCWGGGYSQEREGQTPTRPAIVFLRSLGEKQAVTLIARSETTEQLQNMVRILSFLTQSPDTEATKQIQSHTEHQGGGDAHYGYTWDVLWCIHHSEMMFSWMGVSISACMGTRHHHKGWSRGGKLWRRERVSPWSSLL